MKPGEVVRLASQTVGHPGSQAGAALKAGARMHEVVGGRVLGVVGHHRSNEGHIIDAGGQVGKELADRGAGVAVALEAERRPQHHSADLENGGGRLHPDGLAAFLLQPGLGVEGVHLRRPAVHEEKDHRLGSGRVVSGPGSQRDGSRGRLPGPASRPGGRTGPGRRSRWRTATTFPGD